MISTPAPIFVTLTKTGDRNTIADHPIHEGHTVQGWLMGTLAVGRSVTILRTVTNGREAMGVFYTSPVQEIASSEHTNDTDATYRFSTANSVYALTLHSEPKYTDGTIADILLRQISQ